MTKALCATVISRSFVVFVVVLSALCAPWMLLKGMVEHHQPEKFSLNANTSSITFAPQ
jgi:hypothetical protein